MSEIINTIDLKHFSMIWQQHLRNIFQLFERQTKWKHFVLQSKCSALQNGIVKLKYFAYKYVSGWICRETEPQHYICKSSLAQNIVYMFTAVQTIIWRPWNIVWIRHISSLPWCDEKGANNQTTNHTFGDVCFLVLMINCIATKTG